MRGEYDAVHLSSLILGQRPMSPNNRQRRNMNMSRAVMLILLMPLVIRLANSSMYSNAAGQELKKKNG